MNEIPGLAAIHRRHKDVKPEPLFDMQPASVERAPRTRSPQVVDTTTCPVCQKTIGFIAQYDSDAHKRIYVLKKHDRVTYGGHRFRCKGSGAEV